MSLWSSASTTFMVVRKDFRVVPAWVICVTSASVIRGTIARVGETKPTPTMDLDGDDRGPRRGGLGSRVDGRLAQALRGGSGAQRRADVDDLGDRRRTALRGRERGA